MSPVTRKHGQPFEVIITIPYTPTPWGDAERTEIQFRIIFVKWAHAFRIDGIDPIDPMPQIQGNYHASLRKAVRFHGALYLGVPLEEVKQITADAMWQEKLGEESDG